MQAAVLMVRCLEAEGVERIYAIPGEETLEIVEALRGLARLGLYVEPTSAVAAAGLTRLLDAGVIRPQESTVLVLTGTGLKASATVGEVLKLGARSA